MSTSTTAFRDAVVRVRAGEDPRALASELYAELTDRERLGLLDGDTPFWSGMEEMVLEGYVTTPLPMGAVDRLGIPGVRFVDGPRGICVGHSTAFPVSMARGATWDRELEERVGTAIGLEGRAQGGTLFAGVCINLPRHPAWGRAQETYGEDPLILGEMGAALTRGVQRNLMACAKHYALNSMENARFSVDVTVDEAALHEYFLPHFKRVVDEGVCSIMSAYNSVNGTWAGQSEHLLTTILRDDWGFDGFVMTDFIWGMRDPAASLTAGQDLEAPFAQQRAAWLPEAIEAGRASWDDVERSGMRILATALRFHGGIDDDTPGQDVVAGPAHVALAREVAQRSMVLLKNDPVGAAPVLPLDAASLRTVAVAGRLADVPNTGDHGSSDVRAPYVVTPLSGLRAALAGVDVMHVTDPEPAAAAAACAGADVAVVVVGYTAAEEGEFLDSSVLYRDDLGALYPSPVSADDRRVDEALRAAAASNGSLLGGGGAAGGDRASIRLLPDDVALIKAVAARNPRTVVAVVAAGAVIVEEWRDEVPAILLAWYAGMEGGNALADVLLGRVDAAGRLPFSIPTSEEHLPFFDPDATEITYDQWFGQRLLDRLGVPAAFPLGFGLSYADVVVTEAVAVEGDDGVQVRVRLANRSPRDGRHVVQLYARDAQGVRHLVGFAATELPASGDVSVVVEASMLPLGSWNARTRRVEVPEGIASVEVARFSGDPAAIVVPLAG